MIDGGAAQVIGYGYDPAGNLTLKSDYASSYSYTGSGPNAVSSVTLSAGGSVSFGYDGNGNLTSMSGSLSRTLSYTAFNKPETITSGSLSSQFSYGADGLRYRQLKSSGERTYYLDKFMEIETLGSSTDYRHYLSDVAILTKVDSLNDPNPSIDYLHRDRLGSLTTITDDNGIDRQGRGFDPFGRPRNGDASDRTPPTLASSITERGFTEHEHLDDHRLIHMNGRAYDYQLGRFLSVDPIIQAPGNSQSLNPYSYLMNNPLSGTDPSGYIAQDAENASTKAYGYVTGSRLAKEVGSIEEDDSGNRTLTLRPGFELSNGADKGQSGSNDPGADADEINARATDNNQTATTGSGSSTRRAQCEMVDACNTVDYDDAVNEAGATVVETGGEIVEEVGMTMIPMRVPFWGRLTQWIRSKFSRVPNSARALPAPRLHDHHLFPQQFRGYFQKHGIDIDQHTVSLGENNHLIGVHGRGLGDMPGRWNQRWQQFIDQNPNATSKDVYQQLGRMMDEFGMNDLPIKPYGQ